LTFKVLALDCPNSLTLSMMLKRVPDLLFSVLKLCLVIHQFLPF